MFRTFHIARLVLAAGLVFAAAPNTLAQTYDSPVPAYLMARAAYDMRAADMRPTIVPAEPVAAAVEAEAAMLNPLVPTFRTEITGDAGRRPLVLPVLYATLGVLQGMDYYTTQKGLALGAHETNPIVRNGTKGTFLAMKAGSTAVTILIAEKMWKKNKAGAIALMVATNAVYGAVVAHNARVIGQAQ